MKIGHSAFLFLLLLTSACGPESGQNGDEEKYVEFESVQEVYIDLPGNDNPQFDHTKIKNAVKKQKANLAAVLVYHGIPVRYTKEGKITIPESFAADSSFLYKLSAQAKDSSWYRMHLAPR